MTWNPFVRDPHFMYHLKTSILHYHQKQINSAQPFLSSSDLSPLPKNNGTIKKRRNSKINGKGRLSNGSNGHKIMTLNSFQPSELSNAALKSAQDESDSCLNNFSLRFARQHPRAYTHVG
jgi:hypothetical protein